MSWPFRRRRDEDRVWIAEATVAALETAARCPDIDEILHFWAREIAGPLAPARVALLVQEGSRWLRVLPEDQQTDVPFLSEPTLASALASAVLLVEPDVQGRESLIVRYSAQGSWRGLLILWSDRAGEARRKRPVAQEIAAAIGRSLTALRRAELSREQSIATERSRWAAELHDGHLQTLSSAKIHAQICQTFERQHREVCIAFDPAALGRLETELARLHDMMGTAIREARQFLLELRSPPVSEDQFIPWLRAYADDFSRETAVRVDVRVEGSGTLGQSQVEEGTRLIREALTNVRKHARAGAVRIVVAFADHGTTISVADDGVGFDVKATMERLLDSSHNGLIGSRYRAESVGGEMRLRSEVGRGTSLVFRLPKAARRTTTEIGRRRAAHATLEERDQGVRDSIRSSLAEPAGLVDDSGGVARRGEAP